MRRRRRRLAVAVLALACTAAAAGWAAYAFRSANARPSAAQAVQSLVQRCSVQMITDTCSVMKAPSSSEPGTRLFIAGVGEVDASAFAALRSYGDAMCQAVGAQCTSDWDGKSCRIARALYPSSGDQ